MKSFFYLLIPIALLSFAACQDDDPIDQTATVDVEIQFKGMFDGQPLIMQNEFMHPDGNLFRFVNFEFYVANLALLTDLDPSASDTELKEIDYVDLGFGNLADAEAGDIVLSSNIPVGTYKGLKIGVGVPSDINKTDPEDYGSNHVLSEQANYWDAWESYIFAKIDGASDINGDGDIVIGGSESEGLSFHTGTDKVYTEITLTKDIEISVDGNTTMIIEVDLKDLFTLDAGDNPAWDMDGDGYLDFETYNGTHTDAQQELATKLMENLIASFEIVN